MINTDNIKRYFNKFVKLKSGFREFKLYNIISDYLIDYYTEHSLYEIPYNHKLAYEENIIPTEWYDIILVSNGFDSDIIRTLTEREKYILLNSFMDFNKFKGSINQIFKVAYAFDEKLCLYELYLNYVIKSIGNQYFVFTNDSNIVKCFDELAFVFIKIDDWIYPNGMNRDIARRVIDKQVINDEYFLILDENYNTGLSGNFYINYERWYFLPYLIYKHPEMETKILNEEIEFHKIEPYIKSFLITKEYLDELRLSDSVILPIKTNLIMMDYGNYNTINPLYNLFSVIIMKEIQNERMVIFFKDSEYNISILNMYKLWYYILYKYTNSDLLHDLEIDADFIVMSINDTDLTYTINDIDTLLGEYDEIKTNRQLDTFYREKISSKFSLKNEFQSKIDNENLYSFFENTLSKELLDYIENRISGSNNKKLEINFILDEIYNSIITWTIAFDNKTLNKHLYYFLNNLSKISFKINESPTFKLIQFLKPFHTEIVYQFADLMLIKDKFNTIYLDYDYILSIINEFTSIAMLSNDVHYYTKIKQYDVAKAISTKVLKLIIEHKTNISVLTDAINHYIKLHSEFPNVISDDMKSLVKYEDTSSNVLISEFIAKVIPIFNDDISVLTDAINHYIKLHSEFPNVISDDMKSLVKYKRQNEYKLSLDSRLISRPKIYTLLSSIYDLKDINIHHIIESSLILSSLDIFKFKGEQRNEISIQDQIVLKKYSLLCDEDFNVLCDEDDKIFLTNFEIL
jgi:hypothetical protein